MFRNVLFKVFTEIKTIMCFYNINMQEHWYEKAAQHGVP